MKLKKIMATVISVAMIVSCVNFTAFAEGTSTEVVITSLQGEGTENSPYLISNLAELKWFRDQVDLQSSDGTTQFTGKYFKLTNDINLDEDNDGIVENWNPIGSMSGDHGSFKGIFDGDGHTISNLYVETAGNGLGLFARTAGNAVIKNLTINNATLKSTNNSNYLGAVVANSCASTKIENVHVTGKLNIEGRGYLGGISGHGYVVMNNCSVKAEGTIISSFWCVGGILGYGGEGATNITNSSVEGIGKGLLLTSAAGGIGSIIGMAEDNNGTQPISGSNLSAKNVDIKTYAGGYDTSYAEYALGYLYGGNPTSKLTGTLEIEDVTFETSTGNTNPPVSDAVASINSKVYFSLADALAAANDGDTITVITNITDEAIEIDKNLTITGNVTANNVSINANGCDELTVSSLSFTGNSWINSGTASKLTISGVTANVNPSNATYTNSRSAFISLGRNESKPLGLTVENSNITTSKGTNPILGWATITSATIKGNTFDSRSGRQGFNDSIRIMAIADGAVLTITDNTIASDYNGIVLYQNTTRNNKYTTIIEKNAFIGGADHIWIEMNGTNTTHATIRATSDNTVNGEPFTASDIKVHRNIKTWTSYAGVDIVTDENGKVTGGQFLKLNDDVIAEGYEKVDNGNGIYTISRSMVTTLPNAEVKNLGSITVKNNEGDYKFDDSYYVYDLLGNQNQTLATSDEAFDMQMAMEFIAKDTAEQAAANIYGNYTTDFFIKITGLKDGSFVGDGCYLAGYYPSFGNWVKIPLDGFTVTDGVVYPVITSAGFDFKYTDICGSVQDFICGIYLSDEVIKNNPDIKVQLDLGLSETFEAAQRAEYTTVDSYTYNADDLMLATKLACVRNLAVKNAAGEDRYQVILLFGIDSLMYNQAGFEITVAGTTKEEATRTVYTKFTANGKPYVPSDWGANCNYICGLKLNFPTVHETIDFAKESLTVRPFVEHFDGSRTYGEYGTIDAIYNK